MPDLKTPQGALFWAIGVLATGVVFRLGWELGGKIWSLF